MKVKEFREDLYGSRIGVLKTNEQEQDPKEVVKQVVT
jgi:hypothetical protein